jgi:hypothetical protein
MKLKDWRELICFSLTYRSIPFQDSLVLGNGQIYKADKCPDENLKYLLQRLSQDIIIVMRDLEIDQVEYAFLKCILLFDPGKLSF